MEKVVVEVETNKPESVKIYLKEVLSTLSKNEYFSIKKFDINVVE